MVRMLKEKDKSSFIKKMFSMVEKEPDDIICWINNGTAFEVVDSIMLAEKLLPIYFRHKNFTSLIRQLNFYSFYKVTIKDRTIYQHSNFMRNRPELLKKIKFLYNI